MNENIKITCFSIIFFCKIKYAFSYCLKGIPTLFSDIIIIDNTLPIKNIFKIFTNDNIQPQNKYIIYIIL